MAENTLGKLGTNVPCRVPDKNRFSQSLEYLYDFEDSDNYNLNSETALISALSDYLSLKASYVVKYDNEPVPETLEDTDTILGITLIVSF